MNQKPYVLTSDSHFYVDVDEAGLRSFGGTESECNCILTVMGSGKVVTRENLIKNLTESGLQIQYREEPYWAIRKELCAMADDRRTDELYASIAKGDRHLYIVKSNTPFLIEVCHVGHLVHYGMETCLRLEKPDESFAEAYPVGKLVWLLAPKGGRKEWDVRPVTTMDARAEAEYAKVKRMLFAESKAIEMKPSDLDISGKNPRG